MSIEDAFNRIQELEAGIADHAAQRLDDRCQLDDKKLYELIGITDHPGLAVDKETFLRCCSKFFDSQQSGEPYTSGLYIDQRDLLNLMRHAFLCGTNEGIQAERHSWHDNMCDDRDVDLKDFIEDFKNLGFMSYNEDLGSKGMCDCEENGCNEESI